MTDTHNIENECTGWTPKLSDELGFTLLMVKASEPFVDIRSLETIHRIVVKFAKESNVKIDKTTIEISSVDIKSCFIDFCVGESLDVFSNRLRNLADTLDKNANLKVSV